MNVLIVLLATFKICFVIVWRIQRFGPPTIVVGHTSGPHYSHAGKLNFRLPLLKLINVKTTLQTSYVTNV